MKPYYFVSCCVLRCLNLLLFEKEKDSFVLINANGFFLEKNNNNNSNRSFFKRTNEAINKNKTSTKMKRKKKKKKLETATM